MMYRTWAFQYHLMPTGYRLERDSYEVEPGERVPAIMLVPDGLTEVEQTCPTHRV